MKTLKISALSILLSVTFSRCDGEYEKRLSQDMNDLKRPCIVIAVEKPEADAGFHGGWGSIIIKDATGTYFTFDGNSFSGGALLKTYNVGDTIR